MNLENGDILILFSALTKLFFVEKIVLFGSRARGDYRSRSDIDIAILCPNASKEDWLSICDIVDHVETLLKIDCI